MNVLSSKWVYKHKMNNEGRIIWHKARLVAVGSNQQKGVDFTEAFAPVVKLATIRLILSMVVTNNWKLRQLDISNAFLHDILEENVYMRQPPEFKDNTHPNYMCNLQKSIYGLR